MSSSSPLTLPPSSKLSSMPTRASTRSISRVKLSAQILPIGIVPLTLITLISPSHPQFSSALSAFPSPQALTYAQAGVSVDAGDALVQAIKPFTRSTRRPGADGEIGGFGGLFDLKAAGYKDPLLVSGTDGVGTKLKVAAEVGAHDLVG